MEWIHLIGIIEVLALLFCIGLMCKISVRILGTDKEERERFVEELNGRPTHLDSAISKLSKKVGRE